MPLILNCVLVYRPIKIRVLPNSRIFPSGTCYLLWTVSRLWSTKVVSGQACMSQCGLGLHAPTGLYDDRARSGVVAGCTKFITRWSNVTL